MCEIYKELFEIYEKKKNNYKFQHRNEMPYLIKRINLLEHFPSALKLKYPFSN